MGEGLRLLSFRPRDPKRERRRVGRHPAEASEISPVFRRIPTQKPREGAYGLSIARPQPMTVVGVGRSAGCTSTGAVKATDPPALLRRALAWKPGSLRRRRAARGRTQAHDRVYGVRVGSSHAPPPVCVTSPTMACPPSFTVTRSTRTSCCAFARYFFNASI